MAESLTLNGVDLTTYMNSIQVLRGAVGAPPVNATDYALPRRTGAIPGVSWPAPRVITIGGIVYGNNGTAMVPTDARARYLDRIRSLAALVYANGATYTVTRVIPRAAGGDLTVAATGRYLGGLNDIELVAAHAGRVAFDVEILDSLWYATADTTVAVTGTSTPTVVGDVGTKRMTLTFSGATGQRLTNSTTGEWVQIVGSAVNNTVLDVEAFTAVRSAASVAGEVTHNGAFDAWMSLGFVSATNSLTLTGGGSCSVAYREAYL